MIVPYYDKDGITIYCGDCLEIMPQLDGPFDAIIADLPYGTTACKWDTTIPLDALWAEYKRLIKERGAVVLFGSQPFTSQLVMSNSEWFRDEIIWEKDRSTRHLDANIRPLKSHESLLVFGASLPLYNPQKTLGHKPANTTKGIRVKSNFAELLRGGIKDNPGGGNTDRYPRSVIKFNTPNHRENGFHPTQKPVSLLAYLIRTYTNPGEIILDNTAGSGTTGVAAQQEGRRCVMIEQDEDYCRIAVERLRQPSIFSLPEMQQVESNHKQLEIGLNES